LQVEITNEQYIALKALMSKLDYLYQEQAEPENGEGYQRILLSYNILEQPDFKAERQRELIGRYSTAYQKLGEHAFLNVIKRVYSMNKGGKVDNVKMYCITALEQEIKKRE